MFRKGVKQWISSKIEKVEVKEEGRERRKYTLNSRSYSRIYINIKTNSRYVLNISPLSHFSFTMSRQQRNAPNPSLTTNQRPLDILLMASIKLNEINFSIRSRRMSNTCMFVVF